MAELPPSGLGGRAPTRPDRMTLMGLGAGVLWVLTVLAYAIGFFGGADAPGAPQPGAFSALLFMLGAIGPVALLAALIATARRAEALRREIAALRERLPARGAESAPQPAALARAAADGARMGGAESLKAIDARLAGIEAALASLVGQESEGRRGAKKTAPQRASTQADQPALPFADAASREPSTQIAWSDIVRALDFPRDDHDAAGFAAVRAALRDPEIARLLQAAEDVLSMLASDGLHMEDMRPEAASLSAWKAYAEGARGAKAAAIGGVRDDAALALVRDRMRRDAIFRDSGLVFVRRWSGLIVRLFRELGEDALVLEVADSRSGRAFMLVARAMGAFD